MRPLLGTFVEIGIFEPGASAMRAVAAAYSEIAEFERLMSFQDAASELSRLNCSAGEFIALSARTLRALRLARTLGRASGGLFNCTVGGALVGRGRLPDHDGKDSLAAGTHEDLEITTSGARLRRAVRVTLDGLAKGLAIDAALAMLGRHGVRSAWVNAGGDVRVVGPFALPIRIANTETMVELRNGALATSATDSTYDAAMPGEILGAAGSAPPTGQWTVFAARAWRADALTKVAALAPASKRTALLARLGGRLIAHDESEISSCAA